MFFCTWAYDLILPFRELFQERSRFVAWFLLYLAGCLVWGPAPSQGEEGTRIPPLFWWNVIIAVL